MVEHRVAVVTGANGGIGLAVSKGLVDAETVTVMGSRDLAAGEAAARSLDPSLTRARPFRLDITNLEDLARLAQYLEDEFGRCDILINNAGVCNDKFTPASEVDFTSVEESLRVNAFGQFLMIRTVLPLMRRNHYGRIVTVTSGLASITTLDPDKEQRFQDRGIDARALALGYRMSKCAANIMSRTFACELKGTNILVNLASPGWVRTKMGGATAPRTPVEAADGILWLATLPEDGPTGGFFYDRQPQPW